MKYSKYVFTNGLTGESEVLDLGMYPGVIKDEIIWWKINEYLEQKIPVTIDGNYIKL